MHKLVLAKSPENVHKLKLLQYFSSYRVNSETVTYTQYTVHTRTYVLTELRAAISPPRLLAAGITIRTRLQNQITSRYPKVIPYTNFEHFGIIRFSHAADNQTDKQTNKQTDRAEHSTHAAVSVGMGSEMKPVQNTTCKC